jgi:hypothetical protein
VLFLVVWLWLFRSGHLLRETGGVFLLLSAVDRELAEHVVRIFPRPILVRTSIHRESRPENYRRTFELDPSIKAFGLTTARK